MMMLGMTIVGIIKVIPISVSRLTLRVMVKITRRSHSVHLDLRDFNGRMDHLRASTPAPTTTVATILDVHFGQVYRSI